MIPIPVRSIEAARELDRRAQTEFGIPSLLLMENAARAVADRAAQGRARHYVVLCGGGNNGGDGFAAARQLFQKGCAVRVYLLTDPSKLEGDAALNYRIIRKLRVPIAPVSKLKLFSKRRARFSTVVIDAILGTGFRGRLKPDVAKVIQNVNRWKQENPKRIKILAVDIPSGLNGNAGISEGEIAMKADETVTFACLKPAFLKKASKPFLGKLIVADIGIPKRLLNGGRK